ncbi:Mor transcription activator family protein [Butyrivibrio sp. JL13D10]|uniref:Mor transcription activator family protein n=1 Tax=Butyrivibrio sp. JL13D10 TaxID=3236815 RepID=UPI0038B5C5A0
MKNAGYKTSDIFKNDSLQLNNEEEVIDINSNPKRYSGVYKELAELIGDAATLKVWKRFSGLNITFPQKLYSKEYRKEYIRENMQVAKPAEMAKLLGLSERRVRQIMEEIKRGE